MCDLPNRQADPQITPEMERAGVARLGDLLEAGTSSAYVASEVYLAMEAARVVRASPSLPEDFCHDLARADK